MTATIWLRAETKPQEERTALTPETAKVLLDGCNAVFVERSAQSAIAPQAFADVGCELVEPGSWPQAPDDAYILGLKELPDDGTPLRHRHIYFAHAYKNQQGWQDILRRFTAGGGELLDIEFLLDDNKRRVAAFGYWAGFAGAAVAVKVWCAQQRGEAAQPLSSYPSRDALVAELREELSTVQSANPSVLVIGALGRVGSGATGLADALDLPTTRWDMAETAAGGPFAAILTHEIFINCVFINEPLPPFITREMLSADNRRLRVISDVSCDPFGPHNPVPVYNDCTTFERPTLRLLDGDNPLDLIAIDHLPSMLPVESSEDFSRQLLPHLLQLGDHGNPVWSGALALFHDKIAQL